MFKPEETATAPGAEKPWGKRISSEELNSIKAGLASLMGIRTPDSQGQCLLMPDDPALDELKLHELKSAAEELRVLIDQKTLRLQDQGKYTEESGADEGE